MEKFEEQRNLPEKELLVMTLWFVWKARNNSIFRAQELEPTTSIDLAEAHLSNFSRWQQKEPKGTPDLHLPNQWRPPKEGKLKLNVDGSWKQGEQTGSIAGILRDHTGQVIDGFVQQVRASSPLQVETLAILHGLKLLQVKAKMCTREKQNWAKYI
ncbi:hypothetical protein ACJRO7_007514 [Eucalyptus globulus]|uniref:RNase H type-1 domain-containing protein n=1 Tax=Eucalyptus globulus TaxID=34317 RepID=A0ABD3ILE5_EUCGL